MYEYIGVGLETQGEVNDIFPIFLRWLPKHRLSMPFRCSLEIWHLVIDNLTANDVSHPPPLPFCGIFGAQWWFGHFLILGSLVIFQMCLNPWVGCEKYDECEWALELNTRQVLFEYRHERYWYLGDRVLPQVQHVYPSTTILVPSCPSIRLADLLTNEEITRARVGLVVSGVAGTYFEFIQTCQNMCLTC